MTARIPNFKYDLADIVDMPLPLDPARHAAERLVAVTESWCWKAIARGVGNRVWRSDPIYEPWPSTVVTHQFQILAPGEMPPGSGLVFGPFSSPA